LVPGGGGEASPDELPAALPLLAGGPLIPVPLVPLPVPCASETTGDARSAMAAITAVIEALVIGYLPSNLTAAQSAGSEPEQFPSMAIE